MMIHVLIPCSKTKTLEPSKELSWSSDTTIDSWLIEWNLQRNKIPANRLYSGRSFRQQLTLASSKDNVEVHILSAGAGFINSQDTLIPSYESTFGKNVGPSVEQWWKLPLGGLLSLEILPGDSVVSFAPPRYHRALSKDPNFDGSNFIVPSTSPLAPIARNVIPIHPRSKEILRVASVDLNTEFLRIFLDGGLEEFQRIWTLADNLPPKKEKTSISDENLEILVSDLNHIRTVNELVQYIRHQLNIKASHERILRARKKSESRK